MGLFWILFMEITEEGCHWKM